MRNAETRRVTDSDTRAANVAAIALMLLLGQSPMILMAQRLAMKDKKYLYTMPGGAIEAGETIKQGGKRELFEETGLRVRTENLKLVGKPIQINPSIVIQYMFCHLETAAPWQYIQHTEPDKMGPWSWMTIEEFRRLEQLGVYPDIDATGQIGTLVKMTEKQGSLINRYIHDNSWLAGIHEKDLRRRYGLGK